MIRRLVMPALHGARPGRAALLTAAVLTLCAPAAMASTWAEAGDAALRSDLETLAASGVIDNLTTQWPVPWRRLLDRLADAGALAGKPAYVQEAAQRLKARAGAETAQDVQVSAWVDATNAPDPVRGFDAMGRQNVQGQTVLDWNNHGTTVHLAAGAESHNGLDHQTLVMDGTYVAQQVGGAAIYAGWVNHWWGPGWISALSESTNARPIPQVGITRTGSAPFATPWLSWLGPWQAEFFVGDLDGPRIARNTLLDGLKVSINPLPGFEWGFERLDEACGSGHPCNFPASWFDFQNNPQHPSKTNDELDLDFKYTRTIGELTVSAYMQLMNEDSNPIVHSGTSHLVGLTWWVPAGDSRIRLTAEYTSTVPTANIFSFGDYAYGFAYNDYKYTDGMRYRGRATGFSLDSDSRLATLQASWTGAHDITWTLTYHHADVADMRTTALPPSYVAATINPLSTAPVAINIGEIRARFHVNRHLSLDSAVRYQDDQLRPAHGALGAFEEQINYAF